MPSRSQVPGGLPSGPRSHSHGRSSRNDQSHNAPVSHSIRPQKSLASISSSNRRVAPSSSRPRRNVTPDEYNYRSSEDSSSVTSSSAFSAFSSITGYGSSRTSFEDDDMRAPKQSSRGESKHTKDTSGGFGFGDGSAVWNTVASAASTLTVSVSKAWTANITTFAGEVTPPGGESRLTRAMKAYHKEKANSPADLPSFLFDDREKAALFPPSDNVVQSNYHRSRGTEDSGRGTAQTRGLRDIYAAAASSNSVSPPAVQEDRPRRGFPDSSGPTPSRATDRLKAMRDARRPRNGASGSSVGSSDGRDFSGDDETPARGGARAGLPMRPGRGQRF